MERLDIGGRSWHAALFGIAVLVALVNIFATATPFLSGPLFGPLWILAGVSGAFIMGIFLTGGGKDQSTF